MLSAALLIVQLKRVLVKSRLGFCPNMLYMGKVGYSGQFSGIHIIYLVFPEGMFRQ